MSANLSSATESQQNLVQVTKRSKFTKERRLWWIICILFLLAIILFIIVCCLAAKRNRKSMFKMCTTNECINSAGAILSGLNRSVNPCDNFYEFTCSKWTQEHTVKSWFVERATLLQNHLAGVLLDETTSSYNSSSAENAKILMKSCMNSDVRENLGLIPMFELLGNASLPHSIPTEETVADGWNLAETLAKVQRLASMDILIQLSIVHGYVPILNNSGSLFQLSPPKSSSSSLPHLIDDPDTPQFAIRKTDKQLLIAKLNYVNGIITAINAFFIDTKYYLEKTELISLALKILLVESNFTKISYNYPKKIEYLTAEEFQNFMDQDDLKDSPNRFDVKKYIETLLGLENFNLLDYQTIYINIIDITYFKMLRKILSDQKPQTIQRYVWWKVIQPLIPHLNNEMNELRINYYLQVYDDYKPNSNLRECLTAVKKFYSIAIAFLVSQNNPIEEFKEKITQMFENIRQSFKNIVLSLDWMDVTTKRLTIKKANAMRSFIGYPNWIKNPQYIDEKFPKIEMNKDEYLWNMLQFRASEVEGYIEHFMENINNTNTKPEIYDEWESVDPYEVNAFYKHSENAIFIPAGILQRPFYGRGLESLNYGSIGSILGHEFTHGFDSFGRFYDHNGKRSSWWNDTIVEKFTDKANCFVKQYDTFKLDGNYTLAENIADNGGIREAFLAYKLYIRKNNIHELNLPGLENFTSEQLFFLSYTNMWCGYKKKPEDYVLDSHSPAVYRILGSLSNSPEFSRVWKCSKNSRMNSNKKCIIW